MSQYAFYPSESAASNPSVGTNNTAAPTSSTEIGFIDGSGDLQGVSPSNPLPVAASFSGTSDMNVAEYGGAATTLGQKTASDSIPVSIASDQSAIPVSQDGTWNINNISGTVSLPTGAATEATLSEIPLSQGSTTSGQKGALVQGAVTSSEPTYSDGETRPLSLDESGSLRTTATISGTISSNIAEYGGVSTSLGQKSMAASIPVAWASDQSELPAGTQIIGKVGIDQTTPGTTNAVQATNLPDAVDTNYGASSSSTIRTASQIGNASGAADFGSGTVSAQTIRVTPATDTPTPSSSGRTKANSPARNDYSTTNVTTSAFTELVASTSSESNLIEVFDSSGQTMAIATGGSGSEVIQFYVFPGGNGPVSINIPASTRISVKAISANATVGEIDVNFWT